MSKTSIIVDFEIAFILDTIIASLPVTSRVRTKQDAIIWMYDNLTPEAQKVISKNAKP